MLELSHGAGYHENVLKHTKKFGIARGLVILVVFTQTMLYSFFVTALLRGSHSAMEKSEEETFSRLGDAIAASFRDEFASLMIVPIAALERTGGMQTAAAELLGIRRQALDRRLVRYGVPL